MAQRRSSGNERGSYAKGRAKREEILERALEVIAREGYGGASIKELADAVGLSQAGLLHYFDSKEELFTEVLRKRDEADVALVASGTDFRVGYLDAVRHNTEVPGLVHLFSRLSVDAADPQHPAHQFFIDRGDAVRAAISEALTKRQAAGELTDLADPALLARILHAVADGMQIQWMLDPSVDMATTIDALFDLLAPATSTPGDSDDPAS